MNKNIKKISISKKALAKSKTRDCFDKVCAFIDDERCYNGKIFALYGLRRTGKSYLLGQIKDKYDSKGVEFLEFPLTNENQQPIVFEMEHVYEALDECIEAGKSIVLLDEITNVVDFTYDAALLADYYAKQGVSIIVCGTDSLGLKLVSKEPLLGRKPEVSMTYIPFAEHCRVLGTNDIDDYIMYGGLMREGLSEDDDMVKDIVSQRRYLDSAVSGNISRSLEKYAKYNTKDTEYDEIRKYSLDDIQQIINKLVEDYSGKFDESKINNSTVYNIVDYPLKRFRRTFSDDVRNQINDNRVKISEEYAERINAQCHLSKPATPELMRELSNALFVLGVSSTLNVCKYEKIDGQWQGSRDYKECHIVQPAIKYYQLVEAKKIYMETSDLSHMTRAEREFLANKLQEKIFGDMTETIVQFDTQNALDESRYSVYKPELTVNGNDIGEYDMLIYDKKENSYYGFEIKHTDKPYLGFDKEGVYNGQDKNLLNDDIREVIDADFGNREHVCVLYKGGSFGAPTGTAFLNVAEFLKSLDETHDIGKTYSELTKDLERRGKEIFENESSYAVDELIKKNGLVVASNQASLPEKSEKQMKHYDRTIVDDPYIKELAEKDKQNMKRLFDSDRKFGDE